MFASSLSMLQQIRYSQLLLRARFLSFYAALTVHLLLELFTCCCTFSACSLAMLQQLRDSQLMLLAGLRSRILQLLADTAQQLPALAAIPAASDAQQQTSSSSIGYVAGAVSGAAEAAVWEKAMQQLQQLLTVFVRVHHAVMGGNMYWGLGDTIQERFGPR
jgi:hypothetical protein